MAEDGVGEGKKNELLGDALGEVPTEGVASGVELGPLVGWTNVGRAVSVGVGATPA